MPNYTHFNDDATTKPQNHRRNFLCNPHRCYTLGSESYTGVMQVMPKLTEHVYGVLTLNQFVNGYIIVNPQTNKLALVDYGSGTGFVQAIKAELSQMQRTLDDVAYLLVTHAHPDHYGGLKALQDECDATTIAHAVDAPVIRGEEPMRYADPDTLDFFSKLISQVMLPTAPPAARVDRTVDGDAVLDDVYPGLQVLHLPGHSPGQIGFYLPDERTLIAGDTMAHFSLFGGLTLGLSVPIKAASTDWPQVKRSIKRVADELQVDNLLIAHGAPIIGGANARIKKFAARLRV